MSIITDISEVRKVVSIFASSELEDFAPYFDQAQKKYLVRYLSKDQTSALQSYINAGKSPDDPKLNNLIPFAQAVVIHFGLVMASPDFDINTGSGGFSVSKTDNLVPASRDRVDRFMINRKKQAYDAVEELLQFLESQPSNYQSWAISSASSYARKLFITTAKDFHDIIDIGESRLKFMKMRPKMEDVENLRIIPNLTEDLANEIKAQNLAGNLTAANKALLSNIQRAVAHLTMASYPGKEKHEATGMHYLQEVQKTLEANPNNYPAWRDSDANPGSRSGRQVYDNSEDNPTFIFGAGL